MKIVSRIAMVLAVLLGGLVVFPGSSVFAATTLPQCEALNNNKQKLRSNVDQQLTTITSQRTRTNTNFTKEVSSVNNAVVLLQKEADKKRKENVKKLEKKANTTEQKKAVQAYGNEVAVAVANHRIAYNGARTSFTAGLNSILATYRIDLNNGATNLKTSFDSGVTAAVKLCYTKGATEAEKTITPSVVSAQNVFLASKAGTRTLGDQITKLETSRQSVITKADEALEAALKTARDKLGIAFGKDKALVLGE